MIKFAEKGSNRHLFLNCLLGLTESNGIYPGFVKDTPIRKVMYIFSMIK